MKDITINILHILVQPHDSDVAKKLQLIERELPNMLPEIYQDAKNLMSSINGAAGEIVAMRKILH